MTGSTTWHTYSGQKLFGVILTIGQELFGAVLVLAQGLFTAGALWSLPVVFVLEHVGIDASNGRVFAGRAISLILAVIFFVINYRNIRDMD